MSSLMDFEEKWDLEAANYQQHKPTPPGPEAFPNANSRSKPRVYPRNTKALRASFAPKHHANGHRKDKIKPGDSRIADWLPGERDNEAKAAWRKRLPPAGTYELPCGYDKLEPRIFARDRAAKVRGLEKSPYFALEQIGTQTGAHIEPPSKLSTRFLKIWGNETQLQSATAALQNWVARRRNKIRLEDGKRWIKTGPEPSARKRVAIDKRMQEEALKQSFRRNPEDTEVLTAVGMFLAPSDEYDVQAVLGQNLEAFDRIRIDCRCYIVFEEERSAFKVLSNDVQSLREALRRIRVAFCELASRNSKSRKLYLLEPPAPEDFRKEISFDDQYGPPHWVQLVEKHTNVSGVVPVTAGPKPAPEDIALWNNGRPRLSSANRQSLKHALLKVLADLRFYRGHIQMRVHFGMPVLLAYKKPIGERHTFEEFLATLGLSQTRGELIKCIGDDELVTALMFRCCQSTDMFVPGDAMTYALEDIKPVLSASFDFTSADRSGPIRLELDFKEVEDNEYEISAIRWLKESISGGQYTDVFGGIKRRRALNSMTLNLDK
ncbi:hypothetical protein GP486_006420 [Trichoglossum hirsutum]|uniref:DUF7905 domain-containing protein n=1 Tax=Trichoglossum hirsutum TaxID=265104 RepID=A0A9P8I850_9PEZI|nr:hypothetical protein GP486_006420 [Trichoglossum hirsutum]